MAEIDYAVSNTDVRGITRMGSTEIGRLLMRQEAFDEYVEVKCIFMRGLHERAAEKAGAR
ncbi:MAG: hypothetical protein IT539_18610 [Bradyrhizobiaceae bacterium]|nr:hypothetical protein [Bradyrhizobiaceae bacterium]